VAAAVNNEFQCLTCGGRYFDRCPDGMIYIHKCGIKEFTRALKSIPYDNPRDENTATTKSGAITGIVSEGAGVTCLTDDKLMEPMWITTLKRRVAEQGN
jgi:hypothetical protein